MQELPFADIWMAPVQMRLGGKLRVHLFGCVKLKLSVSYPIGNVK